MLRGSGPTYREAAFSCFLTTVVQDGRICCCCFQLTYSVTIQSPWTYACKDFLHSFLSEKGVRVVHMETSGLGE